MLKPISGHRIDSSLHGRPQEFFQGGKFLRGQILTFVYKTKLVSAEKFNVSNV